MVFPPTTVTALGTERTTVTEEEVARESVIVKLAELSGPLTPRASGPPDNDTVPSLNDESVYTYEASTTTTVKKGVDLEQLP